MEVNKMKMEISKFFKMSGLQICSDVVMLLVEKYKETKNEEKRDFLNKILTNIQGQNIENNSIEIPNIITALRVSYISKLNQ